MKELVCNGLNLEEWGVLGKSKRWGAFPDGEPVRKSTEAEPPLESWGGPRVCVLVAGKLKLRKFRLDP